MTREQKDIAIVNRNAGHLNRDAQDTFEYQQFDSQFRCTRCERALPKALLAIASLAVVSGPITVGMLNPARILAQSNDMAARPSFEVASIKVNNSGTRQASFEVSPGGERLIVRNWPLLGLIVRAYDVSQNQVSGNPLASSHQRTRAL